MEKNLGLPEVTIDAVSYCAVPINLINIETKETIANATGFFYKQGKTYYLITNWHNLTGIDPNTKKRKGDSPTGLSIPFLKHKTPFIKWDRRIVPLYNIEKPKWCIHPDHKEKVDVAALELGENDDSLQLIAVNEIDFDQFRPTIADDVFILGFPHNLRGGGNFPIWKRGSIATEPDIDLDSLPKFLVDSASRPGMSGSPVIYRRKGIHGLADGRPTNNTLFGEIQNFCGIYSGRINTKTELDTQLGVVWKSKVITEILKAKTKDSLYYPNTSF